MVEYNNYINFIMWRSNKIRPLRAPCHIILSARYATGFLLLQDDEKFDDIYFVSLEVNEVFIIGDERITPFSDMM